MGQQCAAFILQQSPTQNVSAAAPQPVATQNMVDDLISSPPAPSTTTTHSQDFSDFNDPFNDDDFSEFTTANPPNSKPEVVDLLDVDSMDIPNKFEEEQAQNKEEEKKEDDFMEFVQS